MPDLASIDSVAVDEVVNRLFEIGLMLSAFRGLVDQTRTARVDEAIDRLDGVIHDLRLAAFEHSRRSGDGLISLLRAASTSVDSLWRAALSNSGVAAVDLGEASHALHRAVVAFDAARSRSGDGDTRTPRRSLRVEVLHEPGVQVVRLRGELSFADADALAALLVSMGGTAVKLDLQGLTFMDRQALAALLEAKRTCEREGRDFVVDGATGAVRRLFEVLEVSDLL